jgi:hypothetical protein
LLSSVVTIRAISRQNGDRRRESVIPEVRSFYHHRGSGVTHRRRDVERSTIAFVGRHQASVPPQLLRRPPCQQTGCRINLHLREQNKCATVCLSLDFGLIRKHLANVDFYVARTTPRTLVIASAARASGICLSGRESREERDSSIYRVRCLRDSFRSGSVPLAHRKHVDRKERVSDIDLSVLLVRKAVDDFLVATQQRVRSALSEGRRFRSYSRN